MGKIWQQAHKETEDIRKPDRTQKENQCRSWAQIGKRVPDITGRSPLSLRRDGVKVLGHKNPRARAQTLVVPDTLKPGPLHDGKAEAHFGHDHAGGVCVWSLTPPCCQLLICTIQDL